MLVRLAMDTKTMTTLSATGELLSLFLVAGVWLLAGALIGGFHFLTLHWNVQRLTTDQSPVLALAIQCVRFIIVAALLTIIVRRFGAWALLVVTAGFLAVRSAVLRLEGQ
jgi:F1F0 ATPase subunit 2